MVHDRLGVAVRVHRRVFAAGCEKRSGAGSLGVHHHGGADDTALAADDGATPKQWLERAAYSYQIGLLTSLAVGVRRIIGAEQQNQFVDAANVSAAPHDRIQADDLYLVYGDANALMTPPRLLLKWVHYFGAENGT